MNNLGNQILSFTDVGQSLKAHGFLPSKKPIGACTWFVKTFNSNIHISIITVEITHFCAYEIWLKNSSLITPDLFCLHSHLWPFLPINVISQVLHQSSDSETNYHKC